MGAFAARNEITSLAELVSVISTRQMQAFSACMIWTDRRGEKHCTPIGSSAVNHKITIRCPICRNLFLLAVRVINAQVSVTSPAF